MDHLLNDSVLQPLRQSFERMIGEYPDTDSQDSVVRQLREIYVKVEKTFLAALEDVEKTVKNFVEYDLNATRQIVEKNEARTRELVEGLQSFRTLQELNEKMETLGRFAKEMQQEQRKLDRPRVEFYIVAIGRLQAKIMEIIRGAEDQAKAVVAAGRLADAAAAKLNTDSASKH